MDVISISDTDSSDKSMIIVEYVQHEEEHEKETVEHRQSSISRNNEVEVVTLSSQSHHSTERCPVTWNRSPKKSNLSLLNSNTFCSPSPRSKVSIWLYGNGQKNTNTNAGPEKIPQEIAEPQQNNLTATSLTSFSTVSTIKSSILVRQDYRKEPIVNPASASSVSGNTQPSNVLNGNHNNKYVTIGESTMCDTSISSLANANSNQNSNPVVSQYSQKLSTANLETESIAQVEIPRNTTPQSVRNMHNLVENMSSLCDSQPAFTDDSDGTKIDLQHKANPLVSVPLSPETQKKIELCEYLKLMNMNPSDKKTVGLRQNRRSSRVKHLALMSERRELERKLNSETRELEMKKTPKNSDSDSRHSTDTDSSKGLKLPAKKNTESVELPTLPKSPTRKDVLLRKYSLDESRSKISAKPGDNSIKIPSKSLQVPEVSTTSVPKSKTPVDTFGQQKTESTAVNRKKLLSKDSDNNGNSFARRPSSSRSRRADKENDSNSSSSIDITKRSFMQLCAGIKNFKLLNSMRSASHKPMNHESNADARLPFSLANTASNIPTITTDFDDCIKTIIDATSLRNLTRRLNRRSRKKAARTQSKLKIQKTNALRNSIKAKLRYKGITNEVKVFPKKRKAQALEDSHKRKIPKLNGLLGKMKFKKRNEKNDGSKFKTLETKSPKDMPKKRKCANARHVNRLRSRGRLKRIGIKTILLQEQRKKDTKKKFKEDTQLDIKDVQEKDFKSTELIQHGSENNSSINDTKDVTNSNAVIQQTEILDKQAKIELLPSTSFNLLLSPTRTLKLKSELDLLKNLTPEHRKALFESKKFLNVKTKESLLTSVPSPTKTASSFIKNDISKETRTNTPCEQDLTVKKESPIQEQKAAPPCFGFETTEIYTDELHKMSETCSNISKSTFRPVSCVDISQQTLSEPQASRPSSEDLEVDQLMNCKRLKDQATQIDSESPVIRSDALVTDPVLTDRLRCTSSSNPASSNSWSLQTVETDPESSNCSSKPDIIEIACTSPVREAELQVSDSVVEISSSTREDVGVCENGYVFSESVANQPEVVNISQIQPTTCEYVQLDVSNNQEVKSLHHCLTRPQRKQRDRSQEHSPSNQKSWEEHFDTEKSSKADRRTSQSHTIYLSNENGAIMNAYYLDYNLIIVQELVVSFWNQTPLGNVLGTQDMWLSKGNIQRLVLGNGCVHKDSSETIMSLENSVAYVELWTKEHKSDKRERPVADIFVTIYLRLNQKGPDKRVLQLENIHGYASDVQYIVLRNSRNIIVSWNVNADSVSTTLIHCYQLSPDYQTVTSIREMQTVSHYVSSLHNIEDCDILIMGCGDDKITLWNVEHGYVVATIDLMVTKQQPRILWAKCDRGFLFTLHHFDDGLLSLIAINSFDSTWKKLQIYKPALEHDNLHGVCMENGLVVAFYDTGVLCWKAETGELIVEDSYEDSVFLPFGKYVVVVLKNQVHVRHALEYLVTIEDS